MLAAAPSVESVMIPLELTGLEEGRMIRDDCWQEIRCPIAPIYSSSRRTFPVSLSTISSNTR